MAMHWYVVHAYSGFEKSVMRALKERIERAGMQDSSAKFWCRSKKSSK
jgi:transcription termination/antitermination protein NusG